MKYNPVFYTYCLYPETPIKFTLNSKLNEKSVFKRPKGLHHRPLLTHSSGIKALGCNCSTLSSFLPARSLIRQFIFQFHLVKDDY